MRTYYIREIGALEGHLLPEDDTVVVLKKGYDDEGNDLKNHEVEIVNEKIRGKIEFTKLDQNNQPLEGATFGIYKSSDAGFTNMIKSAESDEYGKVIFKDMEYGDYIIRENLAPEGYIPSTVELEVSISEPGEIIIDEPIVNEIMKGDIEIIKLGEDREPLEGAKFTVTGDKNFNQEYTTDKQGRIELDNLEYGVYTITEVVPPKGYNLSETDTNTVSIDFNGAKIRVEFDNTKIRGSLEILKIDSRNENPLANARFTLYDSDMEKIEDLVTGQDGKVIFENLEYGKYFYEETKAPSRYYRDDTVYELNIPENEDETLEDDFVITKVVENTRRPSGGGETPPGPETPGEPGDPEDPTDPSEPGMRL